MKLPTPPTHGPMRTLRRTAGRLSGFTLRILASAPAASVALVMSGTTEERSRITPFLSRMPGFSRPFAPNRSSFMGLRSPD